MSLWNLFAKRPATAPIAKERLQSVLAHERAHRHAPDFLPALQIEILKVVERYVPVNPDSVRVQLERYPTHARLELDIAVPIGPMSAR